MARPRILVVVILAAARSSVTGALVVQSAAWPAWPETTRLPAADADAGAAASAATARARQRRCMGWFLQTVGRRGWHRLRRFSARELARNEPSAAGLMFRADDHPGARRPARPP